jgi:hypothetical protein
MKNWKPEGTPVQIIDVDCVPYLINDGTGAQSGFRYVLDLPARTLEVEPYHYNGGGTPVDEYYGFDLTGGVDASEAAVREILEQPATASRLMRICDGASEVWDGNNMCCRLDDDAHAALNEFESALSSLPPNPLECWTALDWFADGINCGCCGDLDSRIAAMNDADLGVEAERLTADALADNVIVEGVWELLQEWRTEAREA